MAKGVEDTAFYRWFPLGYANEVGGSPDRAGVTPVEFHDYCARMQRDWPQTMTTLSTHDTKRGEDVRARLAVLTEMGDEWVRAVTAWRAIATAYRSWEGWPDPATDYLIWQTLVGAWPLTGDRLAAYVEKATREAKLHTSWTRTTTPASGPSSRPCAPTRTSAPPSTRSWAVSLPTPARTHSVRSSSSSRCRASPTCTRAPSSRP
jgi:maltooligosyltrehalose synthase